jgi:predicted PurR-regulated permease PerM
MSHHRPDGPAPRRVQIDIGRPTILFVAVAVAAGWLLLKLWVVVLVIVVALMLVGMLAPPIAWLEQKGMRRGWAITAVFFGVFAFLAGFGVMTAPQLVAQASDMVDRLPKMQATLAEWLDHSKLTASLAKTVRSTGSSELTAKMADTVLGYSSKVVAVIAYAVTSLFLSLYLIIERDRIRGGVFSLIPRTFHVRASRVLLNLETIVGGYMRGQVITSVMMMVFTFVVLEIARVPNAVALSVFAGLADVLPYVGALLACGPAVLAAWSLGTPTAIGVLVALAVYQEIESRIIVPRIYGRALRLPASIVMLALLIGGTLFGILGALLALPIAAGIRMIFEELRVELPGEEIDDTVLRQLDESGERTFERRAAGAHAAEAAAIATDIAEKRIKQDAIDRPSAEDVPFTHGKPEDP